jgi:hypothetical protein
MTEEMRVIGILGLIATLIGIAIIILRTMLWFRELERLADEDDSQSSSQKDQ